MSSKKTVKILSINLNIFKCPNCDTTGEYETDNNGETYCKHCGCVIITPYPYTAGKKHKTLSDFQIEHSNKRKYKRMEKIWKKTISVHMQHG